MLLKTILSALVLLSLNHPDGVYQSGDTVRVFATENAISTLVHEQVYEGPQNVIFKYADTEIGWVVAPQDFRGRDGHVKDTRRVKAPDGISGDWGK